MFKTKNIIHSHGKNSFKEKPYNTQKIYNNKYNKNYMHTYLFSCSI